MLHGMRRHGGSTKVLAVLMASVVPAVACMYPLQVHAAESIPSRSAPATYDGATWFDGLFFGLGPVAERLPEYYSHTLDPEYRAMLESPEGVALRVRIRERVLAHDPDVLSRLSRAMHSGNHLSIQREHRFVSRLVANAVAEEPATSLGDYDEGTGLVMAIFGAYAFVLAAHTAIFVVEAAWVYVMVTLYVYESHSGLRARSTLRSDEMVHAIAMRFS